MSRTWRYAAHAVEPAAAEHVTNPASAGLTSAFVPAPRRASDADPHHLSPRPTPLRPQPDPAPRAVRAETRSVVWAGRIALLLVAAGIAWLQPGGWLAVVALLLTLGLARAAGWHGWQTRVVALAVAVYLAAVDYLSWRLSVLSWAGWWIGVPLFLAELHAALHTVGLHVTLWPQRVEPLRPQLDPTLMPIFVLVPTVDEGPEVLGPTLTGALAARERYLSEYPWASVTIAVCNDGRVAGAACSHAVEVLTRRLGVRCITRTVGGGAKAGNVEHARQLLGATRDALVVIFDADQIAQPDFLLRTVPPFADRRVGWVQTGQYYRNRDNPVARWADEQQSLFYRLLCPGKADHDSAFICGTNVVLRARALDEIGGLPTDSVTEDFAASIRLAPRWRSVYLPGVLATGLGPVDMRSYLRQQERWARGTLTVLRRHWRDLVLPRRGGLRAQQRLQYGLAVTHYLSGVRDLVFLAAPVLFLTTGASGVQGATLGTFLYHFVPYYLLTVVGFWHAARSVTSWRAIVIGFALFPVLLRATWMTVVGHGGRFTITPKVRTDSSSWRTARPHLLALGACMLALGVAVSMRRDPAYWLAAAWLAYLSVIICAHLGLVAADTRAGRRAGSPVPRRLVVRPERAPLPGSHGTRPRRSQRRWRVRLAGGVTAAAAVVPVVVVLAPDPPQAAVSWAPIGVPAPRLVGLTGIAEPDLAPYRRRIDGPATLDGWTQEVADRFDVDRARATAAAGGTPWLTLALSHEGRPTLQSSLTAVANGVLDEELDAWARQIVDYGRPIYLTVLPAVDRDYAATSAVTRGGIPQDVPRAWARLRSVFAAAGATNIAWVWSPADPVRDQRYRPPDTQIDLVTATLYQYPRRPWVDPGRRLAEVAQRHPGKPLMVDVSLAGPSARRAAWLAALGRAVEARSDVAAVSYHPSGPYAHVHVAGARAWQVDQDRLGLAALCRLFRTVARG